MAGAPAMMALDTTIGSEEDEDDGPNLASSLLCPSASPDPSPRCFFRAPPPSFCSRGIGGLPFVRFAQLIVAELICSRARSARHRCTFDIG